MPDLFMVAVMDLFRLKREKEAEAVMRLEQEEAEASDEGMFGDESWKVIEVIRLGGFVAMSSMVLAFMTELSGNSTTPIWTSAVVGGLLACHFAAVNAWGWKHLWASPRKPVNVVVTGSTRGIGKAIAREFLRAGDAVFITSRSPQGVRKAVADFQKEIGPQAKVAGIDCDVSNSADVSRLAFSAQFQLGRIDLWINCAGCSGSFRPFFQLSDEQITQVVNTNLLGSLLCTKAAIKVMSDQSDGGHIFNMEGAGSDSLPTPSYAAYGATKAGISQLTGTLQKEMVNADGAKIGIHAISPGMVLTDLLLDGATVENKQLFNIFCEQPETVAAFMVPRIRTVVARKQKSCSIRYLTTAAAAFRLLTAPIRVGRFFDKKGQQVYPSEWERLHGHVATETARLAERARMRNFGVGVMYSLCMTLSYVILATAPNLPHII